MDLHYTNKNIMAKKLRVYKLQINNSDLDNTGVDVISIVNSPAIMKNFVAFNSEGNAEKYKFAITSEEKQIVTGPIMVPDMQIYRNKKDAAGKITDEWYVTADKDTISAVIQKFFKTQRASNTSVEHSGSLLNGVYLIESFQVDKSRGILPPVGYGNIPDGTWFGSMKIEVPEIWADCKSGDFNGFSIEGLFNYAETDQVVSQKSKLSAFEVLFSQ